jgi:hypothetical protein
MSCNAGRIWPQQIIFKVRFACADNYHIGTHLSSVDTLAFKRVHQYLLLPSTVIVISAPNGVAVEYLNKSGRLWRAGGMPELLGLQCLRCVNILPNIKSV